MSGGIRDDHRDEVVGEAVAETHSSVEPGADASERNLETGHSGVLRFVCIFAVTVLTLLAGYRYAVPTAANDWYLFHVAQHTSWLLSLIGHSSTLENPARAGVAPGLARAQIDAWRQGIPAPESVAESDEMSAPLTRWETYRYRMLKRRAEKTEPGETGPFVLFVLRAGLATRIREASTALAQLDADSRLDVAARERLRNEQKQTLSALEAQQRAAKQNPDARTPALDLAFPFTVVPACGAIACMAIFVAAVLAFPARWRSRLAGIAIGIPALYAINCFRLACLALIGAWDFGAGSGGKWFTFAHEYVWQGIYLIFVVALWIGWLEFMVRRDRQWQNVADSAR